MGEEFGRFTIDPEVSRRAAQAHALRSQAMADMITVLGRALAGLMPRRRMRPTGPRPA